MGRLLTNIKGSSSGKLAGIAKSVRAPQSLQTLCDSLTVKVYKNRLKQKVHKPDWKEDTFTANFKLHIENLCFNDDSPIQVIYEEPQLTQSILNGTVNPNSAKRMDLDLSQFACQTQWP